MSLTGLCEVVVVARGIASGDRVAAGEGMVLSLGKSKLKRALFAFPLNALLLIVVKSRNSELCSTLLSLGKIK